LVVEEVVEEVSLVVHMKVVVVEEQEDLGHLIHFL
jgi:hypothetical protein